MNRRRIAVVCAIALFLYVGFTLRLGRRSSRVAPVEVPSSVIAPMIVERTPPRSRPVDPPRRESVLPAPVAAAQEPPVVPADQMPRLTALRAPSDPELARLELRKLNAPGIDGRFHDMYLQLGLSAEEQQRFRDIRLDRNEQSAALFRKAAQREETKDRESLQVVADVVNDHAKPDYEAALVAAFGKERAEAIIAFEKLPYRRP